MKKESFKLIKKSVIAQSILRCATGISLLASGYAFSEPVITKFPFRTQSQKPTSVQVSAYIESYKQTPVNLLQTDSKQLLKASDAFEFLSSYYAAARNGDRNKAIASFSPNMQPALQKKYQSSADVKAVLAPLTMARLDAILFWGNYRFALMSHQIQSRDVYQEFSVIHLLKCVAHKCEITDSQFLRQVGGALLASFTSSTLPLPVKVKATNTIDISLSPVFSGKLPTSDSKELYPINVTLSVSDSNTVSKISSLGSKFSKVIANSTVTSSKEEFKQFYSEKTPSYIDVYRETEDMPNFAFSVFTSWFSKQLPWQLVNVYDITDSIKFGVFQSEKSGGIFSTLFVSNKSGWTYETMPSKFPVWDLISSATFNQAMSIKFANHK